MYVYKSAAESRVTNGGVQSDFAGSTKPSCDRRREGPCFGVWAVVCDLSPKGECVPAFGNVNKRGPFVRETEKRDEKRFGTAL